LSIAFFGCLKFIFQVNIFEFFKIRNHGLKNYHIKLIIFGNLFTDMRHIFFCLNSGLSMIIYALISDSLYKAKLTGKKIIHHLCVECYIFHNSKKINIVFDKFCN